MIGFLTPDEEKPMHLLFLGGGGWSRESYKWKNHLYQVRRGILALVACSNTVLVVGFMVFFGGNFLFQPIDVYSLGFVPIFIVTYLFGIDTVRLIYYLVTGNITKHEH